MADRLISERILSSLDPLEMSPDSGGLEMFAIFQERIILVKHSKDISKDIGREENHRRGGVTKLGRILGFRC